MQKNNYFNKKASQKGALAPAERFTQDPFKKLSSMEEYCRDQHIYFNESERIKYSIKASESLYKEFRSTLNKGFKNYKVFEDHPEWPLLMAKENEIDVQ